MHLSSVKRKPSAPRAIKSIIAIGMVNISVATTPAVTAALEPFIFPVAPFFAISLDTVTGIPLEAAVKNTAKTERQIW